MALPRGYLALLGITVVGLFFLLTTGALVAGDEEAGWACTDWPLCSGRLLPDASTPLPQAIQTVHRAVAMAVGLLIAAVAVIGIRARASLGVPGRWAALVGVLFVIQASVGAAVIFARLEALWRATHLATASAVWAALVVLTTLAYFQRPTTQARRVASGGVSPETA
ncbi:MAG: COX15/CtaA family protein [Anaerolineae bacterium]|nr:COX15/CtaA family protein [Anaerolineae bacterium]